MQFSASRRYGQRATGEEVGSGGEGGVSEREVCRMWSRRADSRRVLSMLVVS